MQKYPEYYEIIKEPVDLKMIALKIQDGHYKYTKQLERDLMIMIKNAKIFNEPKSHIYKVRGHLHKAIVAGPRMSSRLVRPLVDS